MRGNHGPQRPAQHMCAPCISGSHLQMHARIGCMRLVGKYVCTCVEPGGYDSFIPQVGNPSFRYNHSNRLRLHVG